MIEKRAASMQARNRLGGRVISVGIGTSKAELGASWIHGVLGNPLYELAVSQGLVDVVQVCTSFMSQSILHRSPGNVSYRCSDYEMMDEMLQPISDSQASQRGCRD